MHLPLAQPERAGCVTVFSHFISIIPPDSPAFSGPCSTEGKMNADSRRIIEMGTRAAEFMIAHPDSEPGTTAQVTRLQQLLARANSVATAQREGFVHARAATEQKRKLRAEMLSVPIAHLAEVGLAAAREEHELGKTFQFKPTADTYLAFRTAARSMAAAADSHREVLLKYGLSESVLAEFLKKLDDLDAAFALSNSGRTAHVGATREIRSGSKDILRAVRVMNGRNRQRFADDAQLLGSWLGASKVLGRAQPDTAAPADPPAGVTPTGGTPTGGQASPAA
jgi:hypothetical protein